MSQRAQRARRLVLGLSVLGLGATSVPHADFERAVSVPQPGKVFLLLDRDVYESARADLADLRVLDETGAQVPYLLEEPWSGPESTLRQPRILKRGFVGEEGATVTLDFGGPLLKSGLVLSLSGQNFRRRVMVEGRNKHERPWATLTDSAYVFAIPEPSAARFESLALPENNYQYVRVTVFRGPDDPRRVDILNAWARCEDRRVPVRVPSVPPLVPWTERHKGLLWGGLVTVVVLLGGVTWRALKAV